MKQQNVVGTGVAEGVGVTVGVGVGVGVRVGYGTSNGTGITGGTFGGGLIGEITFKNRPSENANGHACTGLHPLGRLHIPKGYCCPSSSVTSNCPPLMLRCACAATRTAGKVPN